MPKPPKVPSGLTTAGFGQNIMRWGTGHVSARARIATLSLAELRALGVTLEMAREWHDFYLSEVARNPRNPSARGRVELMQHAVKLLEQDND